MYSTINVRRSNGPAGSCHRSDSGRGNARTIGICVAVLVVGGVFAPTARANPVCSTFGAVPLAPNSTVFPGDCTGIPAGALQGTPLTASFTTSTGANAGTLVSAVYKEPGGTLD